LPTAPLSRRPAQAVLLGGVPPARMAPTAVAGRGLRGAASVRRCPRCEVGLRPATDGNGHEVDVCIRCELVVPVRVARLGRAVCRQCGRGFTPRRRWHVYC